MLADANALSPGDLDGRVYDVCICGAGVAGITLARALAARGKDVILLEGGGLEASQESQSLYEGRVVGLEYFDLGVTRLRYFGGTSNHWSGHCRPFDAFDFAALPWHARSGWPIAADEVERYLPAAREILDIPPDSPLPVAPRSRFGPELAEFAYWHSTMTDADGTEPTRFGRKYLAAVRSDPHITAFVNANVVDIVLGDGLRAVERIVVRNFSHDRPIAVRARDYVLALGGMENPRLLLNCNRQISAGIGNGRDLVGRFFCEHPHLPIGYGVFNEANFRPDEVAYVGPTEAFLRRNEVLNFTLRVIPGDAVGKNGTRRWFQELACTVPFATRLLYAYGGEFPSWWCDFNVQAVTEQALNPNSRVRLSDDTDPFGHRRIDLDWRLADLDFRTMRVAGLALASFFAEADLGRIRLRDWILSEEVALPSLAEAELAGHHHMCTTRMAERPEDGVVDHNGTVFGIANLHVAGSSTFATASCVNPTLTIVQLALRQADLLAGESKT